MIKIRTKDKERLMKQVEKCNGSVYLHLKDGTSFDLKKDTEASRLFWTMELPTAGIDVTLADSRDFPGFLQYLMEAPFEKVSIA